MSEPAINLPPPSATSVFRGPNGVRAGWRTLIFLAIFAGLAVAVNLVIWLVGHFLLHSRPHMGTASSLSPAAALISDGAILLFSGVAALIMSRIEHRKWQEYGLPVRFAF